MHISGVDPCGGGTMTLVTCAICKVEFGIPDAVYNPSLPHHHWCPLCIEKKYREQLENEEHARYIKKIEEIS